MRKSIFTLVLLLGALLPAAAQTAERLEAVLAAPRLSYAEAAQFALEAADKGVFPDAAAAFRFAREQKWLPKNAAPNDNARLNVVALLLMRAFDIPGGLLYTITKTPRYAYRELVSRNVILGRTDPDMFVSGDDFLFLIGRMFALQNEEPEFPAEPEEGQKIPEPPRSVFVAEERLAKMKVEVEEINTKIEELAIPDTAAVVTDEGIMISLSNIQFLAESAVLAETEKPKLQEIARILQTIPGKRISVAGHTALAGSAESQLQLSYERAQSVADLLISLGARTAKDVVVQGYGAERPIADNKTPNGMAANRRVEITILED